MPAGRYSIRIDLETEIFSFTDESGKHKILLRRIAKNHISTITTLDKHIWQPWEAAYLICRPPQLSP